MTQNMADPMSSLVKNDMEWSSYSSFKRTGGRSSFGSTQAGFISSLASENRSLRRVRTSGALREYRDFFNSSMRFLSSAGGTEYIVQGNKQRCKTERSRFFTDGTPAGPYLYAYSSLSASLSGFEGGLYLIPRNGRGHSSRRRLQYNRDDGACG